MARDFSNKKTYKSLSEVDVNRSIFLFNDFHQESAEKVVTTLLKLDKESKEPINIFINSYGGEVFSLFSIVDTINNIESTVNTICLGEADSCGAVLLSIGDVRYIGSNSRTMIHEVSTIAWGKISSLEERIKIAKDANNQIVSLLAKETGRDADYLKEVMKKDFFMNAKESVELGIVDFVLDEPKIDEDLFNEQTLDFVNSFSGHIKDQEFYTALYAKAIDQGPSSYSKNNIEDKEAIGLIEKIAGFLKGDSKKEKKGEEIMDKEAMLKALKEEHNIDLDGLTARIDTLETLVSEKENTVSELEAELSAAKGRIEAVEKETEEAQLNALLEKLIMDKKATQLTNELTNKHAFKAMGLEAAKEAAEKMPVLFKEERVSKQEGKDVDDVGLDISAIEKLAKEENVDFATATKMYISKKKGE